MKDYYLNNKIIFLSIVLSTFIGVLFRVYNINYDNLWFDEIVSFWISDPNITIFESLVRNRAAEATPFLFNLILKTLHYFFEYDPDLGRYISSFFGILSIFSTAYIARLLKKDNSFVLVIFLIALNVFLIRFSQEMRVYSVMFFLSSLAIIFYLKLLEKSKRNEEILLYSLLFILFQSLAILSHPFTLIIFFSMILYTVLYFLKHRKLFSSINYSFITSSNHY